MSNLTPKGLNHRDQKQYNRGLIFQLLATENNMTRTELASKSGLTRMTLTNIISDFIDRKYVFEYCENGQTPSPSNPAKISLSHDAPKAIGVMIQRTHIAASLCDLQLNVIKSKKVALKDFTEHELMSSVVSLVEELIKGEKVLGIGVASIGPVDIEHGIILNPPDFHELHNIRVTNYLTCFNLPVFFNHHLNCNALAERYFGNGKQYHDFIFLCVDKGINIGIITGNQLYCKNTGFSSEIGRSLVSYNPLSSSKYLGGLGDYVDFTKGLGDSTTLSYMVDILAAVMSGICDILNPQAIILGGEEALIQDKHISQFGKTLNSRIFNHNYRHIDVIKAFRTNDLESSSAAISVIQNIFEGKLLVD